MEISYNIEPSKWVLGFLYIGPNIYYYWKPFLLPCWPVLIHIDLQFQMG